MLKTDQLDLSRKKLFFSKRTTMQQNGNIFPKINLYIRLIDYFYKPHLNFM